MTSPTDAKTAAPRSLTISRAFAAPRELVFQCWTTAERMKRWFSPEGVDVPEAEIDCRPGGVFVICMRMPDGTEHWCRGAFGEVVPPERLSFDCDVSTGGKVALPRPHARRVRHRRRGHADVRSNRATRSTTTRSATWSKARPRAGARRSTSWRARLRAPRPPCAARSRSSARSRRRRPRCSRRSPTSAPRAAGSPAATGSRWSSAAWTCGRAAARWRSANGRAA